MTNIELVKELRNRTQAKLNDCKIAIEQSGYDMNAAIEFLQKKGQADSIKRQGTIGTEGIVCTVISPNTKFGCVVEVNSQTDFCAKSQEFIDFSNYCAKLFLLVDDAVKINEQDLENKRISLVQKLGENITIRRWEKLQAKSVVSYDHTGNKISVLISGNTNNKEMLKNLAMQTAAMNPRYISEYHIPTVDMTVQAEIFEAQLKEEGKVPKDKYPQIIRGKIQKWVKDICLLEQICIWDSKKSIEQYLEDNDVETSNLDLKFIRYELGEGLVKPELNFADEVQALL